MAEIMLAGHPCVFVMAEPSIAPKTFQRRIVIVTVANFRHGMQYYVGCQAVAENRTLYSSMYDQLVTTPRFAVTIYHEARVLFAATDLQPPYTVLPVISFEVVEWTETFEMPDTTLVNRV